MAIDGPTVFVVDDDHALRTSIECLVNSLNLKVESYATASDFLDVYDPARSGCLILDLHLPGMSGLKLLQILTDSSSTLPAIIVTGDGDEERQKRVLDQGAFAYLEKPFHPSELLQSIRHALSENRN